MTTETLDHLKASVPRDNYPPYRDDPARPWDAAAAVARLRRFASRDGSGDKETIDWAKYKTFFAKYDPENPENFGSYKYPHHDVINGRVYSIWRGVVAAAQRAVQFNDEEAMRHLNSEYEKWDREPPWKILDPDLRAIALKGGPSFERRDDGRLMHTLRRSATFAIDDVPPVEDKRYDAFTPTRDELAAINALTLRDFDRNELWIVTIVACDNLVDRTFERFTPEALAKLAAQYRGRPLLLNHNHLDVTGIEMRVFDARLATDETVPGYRKEPYTFVRLRAYTVRESWNLEFRRRVEAGLIREASVGFLISPEAIRCSICARPLYVGGTDDDDRCPHIPGELYDGELCIGEITDVVEPLEISFVAIPAQPRAGARRSKSLSSDSPAELHDSHAGGQDPSGSQNNRTDAVIPNTQTQEERTMSERIEELLRTQITDFRRVLDEFIARAEEQWQTIIRERIGECLSAEALREALKPVIEALIAEMQQQNQPDARETAMTLGLPDLPAQPMTVYESIVHRLVECSK